MRVFSRPGTSEMIFLSESVELEAGTVEVDRMRQYDWEVCQADGTWVEDLELKAEIEARENV